MRVETVFLKLICCILSMVIGVHMAGKTSIIFVIATIIPFVFLVGLSLIQQSFVYVLYIHMYIWP